MNTQFGSRTTHHVLSLCIIAVLCSIIYSNTLGGPFVFDDLDNIQNNRFIRLTSLDPGDLLDAAFKGILPARPVPKISFALNYYFGKYTVGGYHLVNITIHLLNGVLVYFLALLTFRQLFEIQDITRRRNPDFSIALAALFAACLFIAHPIQTQSVTYIVQRMNSMATMFFLLSLLLYILGRRSELSSRRWLLWSGCLCSGVLALGSKQNAATLPLIILLYEWYFFQDLDIQWLKRNTGYIAGVCVVLIIIAGFYLGENPLHRIVGDYSGRNFSIGERVLTEFRVVVFYISLVVFPYPGRMNLLHNISVSHSFIDPPATLLSCLFLAGLFILSIYLARRDRLVSFCILWFFINLVIESSVIGLELIFEHRLYLPMFGIALVSSYLVFSFLSKKPLMLAGCSVVLIVLLGTGTFIRNKVWANDLSLWSDVVAKNQDSYRARINLGLALNQRGDKKDAILHLHKALELNPYSSSAHNDLGIVLKDIGRLDEAIEQYHEAIKYNPKNAEAYYNLGVLFSSQGHDKLAIINYLHALKINPYYTKAHFNLGNALARQGDQEKAIFHYRKVIEQDSESADAHNNLAIALADQGNFKEAIIQFNETIRLNPQYIPVYYNLGKAQLLNGDRQNACSSFQYVYQLKPDFPNIKQVLMKYCK